MAASGRLAVEPAMLPPALAAQWAEWLPAHLAAWPFAGPDGRPVAMLLVAADTAIPPAGSPDSAGAQLDATIAACAHAWWALAERRRPLAARIAAGFDGRGRRWALAAALALLAVPVRDYALVPAEIVSTRSQVIAAPRDGVIARMAVAPNAHVAAGDVLALLDDTTIDNRLAIARGALDTARLELHQASQRAIVTQGAKADLNLAAGRVREREIEVEGLQREREQLAIRAPAAGVFVYSDPDDWAGRPVQTGQRVGLLADPSALGVQAWAPVNESVNLRAGAPVTVFLRVAPLQPVSARIAYAGYQAVESPDGVASYSLRGPLERQDGHAADSPTDSPSGSPPDSPADSRTDSLTDSSANSSADSLAAAAPATARSLDPATDHTSTGPARIGLRGTARIAGDWTTLGWLMFRRPVAAAREWCGC
ncbi:MAG: HlyD family efflux transporter periplasmic adaptor subunit [Burkholderiaceae bacterium]